MGLGAIPAGGFKLRKTNSEKTEEKKEEENGGEEEMVKPRPMIQAQSMQNLGMGLGGLVGGLGGMGGGGGGGKDPLAALRAKKKAQAEQPVNLENNVVEGLCFLWC